MPEEAQNSAVTAFDPEANTILFRIGPHTVKLVPLTIKKLRQVIALIDEVFIEMKSLNENTGIRTFTDIIALKALNVLMVLFPPSEYSFMSMEFLEETLSVVEIRNIFDKLVVMNDLDKLYPPLAAFRKDGSVAAPGSGAAIAK